MMAMLKVIVPRTITISGFTYEIHLTERDSRELDNSYTWGEHSERLRTIRIKQGILPEQFSSTFLHEILHAINTTYNGRSVKEENIRRFANGLLQVMEQLGVRFVERKGEV